jgi:L-malate glycosyltransferase
VTPLRVAHVVNDVAATTDAIVRVNAHDRSCIQPYLISFDDVVIHPGDFDLYPDVKTLSLGDARGVRRLRRMAEYVREEGVQLLHTYHSRSSFWTRWMSRWIGVPNLFEDAATHFSYGVASRTLLMSNVFLSDRILCPSHTVVRSYNALERVLAGRGRVRIVPYGISLAELAAVSIDRDAERRRYGVDPSCLVFVHSGRMVSVKDQAFLLRLFGVIARQRPNVHLLMIGDGPNRPELERLTRELGLGARITFTGMVSRHGVYRLLKASDVFTMTSRSEGLSISLIEALGCGLPSLLTDIPSFRETMKAGKGVVFVTRDEPIEREATRATRELVDAPLNRHRLGREALELARSFYDAKRWMHDLEALYAEIVGAPTARPRP